MRWPFLEGCKTNSVPGTRTCLKSPRNFPFFWKAYFFRLKISCFYEITLLILLILLNPSDERKRKILQSEDALRIIGCFLEVLLEFSFSIFLGITSKEFYKSKQQLGIWFSQQKDLTKDKTKDKNWKPSANIQTVLTHSKNILLSDFILPFIPIQFGKFSLLQQRRTKRTIQKYDGKLAYVSNCVLVPAWNQGSDMPFTLWFKELLYLRHNELRRVPCLRHCTNLKELYLGSNRIQEILPEDISSVLNIR